MRLRRSAALVAGCLAVGCSLIRSLDDLEGGGADRCDESGACRPCPEEMALVRLTDGSGSCIDRRETTQADYQAFLDEVGSAPDVSKAGPGCSANRSYLPDSPGDMPCAGPFTPLTTPLRPVVCVDQCDAVAYCAYRQKRLCDDGLPFELARAADPGADEWYRACAGEDGRVYPYGNVYDESFCNVASDASDAADVDTFERCVTVSGVSDLSGNVAEWTGSCGFLDESWQCLIRGGSYATKTPNYAACALRDAKVEEELAVALRARDRSAFVGFRCCSD